MAPRLTDDQGTVKSGGYLGEHGFISHMTGRNECNTPEMLSWVGGRSQWAMKVKGWGKLVKSLKLLQIKVKYL